MLNKYFDSSLRCTSRIKLEFSMICDINLSIHLCIYNDLNQSIHLYCIEICRHAKWLEVSIIV